MRSTKKAFLLSLLSMLLCVAMLMGTTFAWFTDTVTSGVNTITAGNLDIEVSYLTKNADGTVNDASIPANWADLEGSASVFSSNLWEPGHTEYVTLKIENKGTLALKYRMNVTPVNEKGGINVNGESFKLSDYLMFGTTLHENPTTAPTYADRASARAAVTATATGLNQSELTKNSTLQRGETDYITLVVYMPEDVGNVANYKTGTTAPEIELGIKFIATQYQHETDSFGDDYDKDEDIAVDGNEGEKAPYPAIDTVISYNYFPQVKQSAQLIKDEEVAKKDEYDSNVTEVDNKITINSVAKIDNVSTNDSAATVTFGNDAVDFGSGTVATVTLNVEKKDLANITAEADALAAGTREQVSYDVNVTISDGATFKKASDDESKFASPMEVTMYIGKNKTNVKMYHGDVEMTNSTTKGADTFTYDATTGVVTMYVDHFSDFFAVYDAPVAAIGTTVYYSLESAVEAAQTGDTVVLIQNVEQSNPIFVDKTVALDLNGKTITDKAWVEQIGDFKQQAFFYVKSGANLTVNDSAGTGAITTENSKIFGAICMTIKGDNDESKNAVLVVNGGTLCGYYYGVVTNGTRHNTDITVNGGTLTGTSAEDATSIYHPNKGKLTIKGGTLIGYDALAVKGGTPVTITGGEFIATGTKVVPTVAADSGCNSVGSALYVEGNYGYGAQVVISGGTFTTTDPEAPAVLSLFNEATESTISISGGMFSTEPDAKYIAEGLAAKPDGTMYTIDKAPYWKYYANENGMIVDTSAKTISITTAEGLAFFAKTLTANAGTPCNLAGGYNGYTVNIMNDIDLGGKQWTPINLWYNDCGYSLTINGNGHTIKNMTTVGGTSGFIGITASINLTVKDLVFESSVQTGNGSTQIGVVLGALYGNITFDNVDVKDAQIIGEGKSIRLGALVGQMINEGAISLTLKDCDVSGCSIKGFHNVGGLIGTMVEGKVSAQNCTIKDCNLTGTDGRNDNEKEHCVGVYGCNNYTLYTIDGVTPTNVILYNTGAITE